MSKVISEIKSAIDSLDIDRARELLRVALKENPSSEIYYLASRVAVNEKQKTSYLEKAIELDPFNEVAYKELKKRKDDIKSINPENNLEHTERAKSSFSNINEWFAKQNSLTKIYIIGAGIFFAFIIFNIWASNSSQTDKNKTFVITTPTPIATKKPQWSSDLLVDRDPSLWIPSRKSFAFNSYDLQYGTIYNSNIDVADGSQSKANTLNGYGRIVSFGHDWHAKGCISGNAVPVSDASVYIVVMDSNINAQRYLEYLKQEDRKYNSFLSFETSETTIGEEYYISRFRANACFIQKTEVDVSFRRNNIVGIVSVLSFNKSTPIQDKAIEAAQLLDKAIMNEAKNNPGSMSKLEDLFAYFSVRALNPQSQSSSSGPYNGGSDYEDLSCDQGGPCDCEGADRNSSFCSGYLQYWSEQNP